MRTLKIVIRKEWFDKIKSGEKKIEYREAKPHWHSRLKEKNGKYKEFDRIEFINGYNKNARRMITEFSGVSLHSDKYHIKIGRILKKL
jgi:ASC-1-like (ASCH) protein